MLNNNNNNNINNNKNTHTLISLLPPDLLLHIHLRNFFEITFLVIELFLCLFYTFKLENSLFFNSKGDFQ